MMTTTLNPRFRDTLDAAYIARDYTTRVSTSRVYPAHWATRDDVLTAYPTADIPPVNTEYAPDGIFRSLDNAWRRFNRLQVRVTRKEMLTKLAELGYTNVELRYSRKAGCTCGCSPGFIADRWLRDPTTNRPLDQLSLKTRPNGVTS